MNLNLHSRLYKVLMRHVSLKGSIYFAAFLTLSMVTLFMVYTLHAQQRLAMITHEILDTRITELYATENVKQSLVSYDGALFRYLATGDISQLGESQHLKDSSRFDIAFLLGLHQNPVLQSRVLLLQAESEHYFTDAETLVSFFEKNKLPPHAGVFQAAAWAHAQGAKDEALALLSEADQIRLEHIFALCDELVTANQINLENARARMSETLLRNRLTAIAAGSATGVVVLVVALGLALSLLGPLRALLEGVRKIESGDLNFEIPVTSLDEIGQLTNAFNRMTRRVRQQQEQLVQETITDGLTGIFNQRHFRRLLKVEFERARRTSRPMSLLMMDVDHFKKYNDSQGHEAGNELLKQVAATIRDHLRETDILARYGGDELSVILPETTPEAAEQLARKLEETIHGITVPGIDRLPAGRVTLSIGGASFPEGAKSASDLVVKADEALYTAKQVGRACVRWAGSSPVVKEKHPLT